MCNEVHNITELHCALLILFQRKDSEKPLSP